MHEFLAHDSYPLPLPIAHRGYSSKYPENTMAAFSAAIDLGYKCIETDVHATSDGVLAAFHDPDLQRVTGRKGFIKDMSWNEIKGIKVAGTEPIPLFEDLLASWPDIRVIIDPKEDTAVRPLYQLLSRTGVWERVCVGSFSVKRLDWLRKEAGSKLCTSMGPREIFRLRLASYRVPVGKFAANCVQAPLRDRGIRIIDRAFVNEAHRRNLPVQAWTINDRDTMNWLLDIGIDAIMTDDAVLLKDVFQERCIWRD